MLNTFDQTQFPTLNLYNRGEDRLVRSEKVCTLEEFISMNRLAPGQILLIADLEVGNNTISHKNSETIIVGNCTPYHEPSTSDGGIGWNNNHSRMKKYVIEVIQTGV